MTRQEWRTAELGHLNSRAVSILVNPTQPSTGKTSSLVCSARTQLLLSSVTTTVWGSSSAAAHSVVCHHYEYAKEYAVQPWDACVSARTPHLTASSKTPMPPALASMASRGGETACGEFPASLVTVSDLLVNVLLTMVGRHNDGQHLVSDSKPYAN